MSRLQVYVLPKTPCGAPNPRRPPHHSHTRPSLHKTAKPTTPPNRSRTEPPSPRPSGRDPPRPPKPAHPSPPSPLPPHSPRLPRHQMSSPPRRSPRSSSAGPSSSAVNHCSSPRTQSTAPRRPHPRAHRRLRSPPAAPSSTPTALGLCRAIGVYPSDPHARVRTVLPDPPRDLPSDGADHPTGCCGDQLRHAMGRARDLHQKGGANLPREGIRTAAPRRRPSRVWER